MSHAFWLRYIDVGEKLASHDPDFFPTVVSLLETLADGGVLGALVQDAFGCTIPRPSRSLSAQTVGDLLCVADESLADIADLDRRISSFSDTERRAAEQWARAKVTARGDDANKPAIPDCVARLYEQRRY